MSVAAPSPEPLAGVTLEQYAGITAALADEHPLDAALANEDLSPAAWAPADVAWKERLAADGAEGPIFIAFRDKRGEAEDCLDRSVKPIDTELRAWLAFLHAWSKHPAPFDLLSGAGLRLSDVARLTRRWSRRMAEDEALRKQAAEIAKNGPGPMPAVRVGSSELKPFPWSKRKKAASPPIVASSVERPLEPVTGDGMDLDTWARISAELAEPGADRERVLVRYDLTGRELPAISAAWKARLAQDPEEERDFRRLFEHHRARVRTSRRKAEAPVRREEPRIFEPAEIAPAPRPKLAGTSLLLDVPRGPALPFVDGEAPPEVAEGGIEIELDAEGEEVLPVKRFTGTALALDLPRGPSLPFPGAEAGAPVAPVKKLAGTALALDVPSGPALPFVDGEAPAEIAEPARDAPAPKKDLGGTALALDVPRGPALPFAGSEGGAALPRAASTSADETKDAQAEGTRPSDPSFPSPPPSIADPNDAPRAAKPFTGTALAFDVPASAALPFVDGEAPASISEPSRETPAPKKQLGGTALALDLPHGPALPFAPSPEGEAPAPAKSKRLAKLSLGMELPRELFATSSGAPTPSDATASAPAPASVAAPASAATPPPASMAAPASSLASTSLWSPDAAAVSETPPLTLQQHASLCVELSARPERAAEIFGRYRVTPAQKEQMEAWLRDRFAREPALRDAWNQAYVTYRDWLAQKR
ncbi:Basic proline-rich protein [Minicystis rosea]|nr:Basic proline-rich protein [Minicystis rosea]